eukprot:TRINITY_DN2639_c0_g1_i2.p1 TRINITY_DN2639_c0_g1~~TRINITY_DN2639_c0_g1_i2.p1  ORF type:complete len:361 (+),score=58.12 TRINITY_DN2639_c0_g1_i2:131-1213(+)
MPCLCLLLAVLAVSAEAVRRADDEFLDGADTALRQGDEMAVVSSGTTRSLASPAATTATAMTTAAPSIIAQTTTAPSRRQRKKASKGLRQPVTSTTSSVVPFSDWLPTTSTTDAALPGNLDSLTTKRPRVGAANDTIGAAIERIDDALSRLAKLDEKLSHEVTAGVSDLLNLSSAAAGTNDMSLKSYVDGAQERFAGTPKKAVQNLTAELDAAINTSTEGHTEAEGELAAQTDMYDTWATMDNISTICETGFNAGHSALRFLSQSVKSHIYEFDLGEHAYGKIAEQFLTGRFPGRLTVTWGSSVETLPKFAMSNPDVKCDLVIVDGDHAYATAIADLVHFAPMASPHHILTIDDTPCEAE